MSVTYGFYNSKNGDRRYDAIQMSSIFDGIIRDGILQHVGTAMMVTASEGMTINVGIGRAWFNHTWTLNDALLPLTVSLPEVILNRVDAVVLEVDARESVRANSIKIIKGTPSSSPNIPTLIKTNDRWQYPLAYIRVNAGVTAIRQADITNCVGTSSCPFVTAPLEKMSIDSLIAQWKDQWTAFFEAQSADIETTTAMWKQQWQSFYENETADMEATHASWDRQWSSWFNAKTAEINNAYSLWRMQWNDFFSSQTAEMKEVNTQWKQQWQSWFHDYTNNYISEMARWRAENESEFNQWFSGLQETLSGDVATNLAGQLSALETRMNLLEQFAGNLQNEYAIYSALYDGNQPSEPVLDSNGEEIEARVIFTIK